MYRKHKGGSTEMIQGIEVNIPPVGYVWNPLTKELEYRGVLERSKKKEDQYWERMRLPEDWTKRRNEELDQQEVDPEFVDHDLEQVRQDAWDRRLCGVWFKSNGKDVYVTGLHAFYLDWIYIGNVNNNGYPDYRDSDRKFFYHLDYCIQDPRCLGSLYSTKRREGKCFAVNTLVRMYDGSVKTVQDVKDGELVMGDDSTPRVVSGVTSGREEMYEIIPRFGKPFTVNKSHILACKEWARLGPRGSKKSVERNINISVGDYLNLTESRKKKLRIYRECFQSKEVSHVIDPYFLGVWLGDGMSRSVEIANEDEEVINYLKNFAKREGLRYHNYGPPSQKVEHLRHSLSTSNGNIVELNKGGEWVEFESKHAMMRYLGKHVKTPLYTFGMYKDGLVRIKSKARSNHILDELNRLNLIQNKHIPYDYLNDSIENRLKLLAGLIDTDGCITGTQNAPAFQISFGSSAQKLRDDVCLLLDSLGFVYKEWYCSNNGCDYIRIMGDLHLVPTLIKRKQSPKENRVRPFNQVSFKVNPVGEGEYYGFTVDKNHLFLLADGTVVHNTAKSIAFLLDLTTRSKEKFGGIQSKTDKDASDVVFDKGVVRAFKKLPDFFTPQYDLNSTLKKNIKFIDTPVRGVRKAKEKRLLGNKPALGGGIDYRPSKETAYDGSILHRYVADEIFKTENVDIRERHNVVKYCCTDTDGNYIGKMLCTSTVEEIEGDTDIYRQFWADSNPAERNPVTGRTKTGLYRYFLPSDEARNRDKYGFCDTQSNRDFILADRESVKNDQKEYNSKVRKEPLTVEEAFRFSANNSIFDVALLNNRLDFLSWQDPDNLYVQGDLSWVNSERDSEVQFRPKANGKFKVLKSFLETAPRFNRIQELGQTKYPRNTVNFVVGIDPFSHNRTEDPRASKGAAYGYCKYDPNHEENSGMFIVEYCHRPPTAEIFFEDMIMLCHWLGCKAMIENNRIGIIRYFESREYQAFLYKLKGRKEPGLPSSKQMHQRIAELTEEYHYKSIEKVYFIDLIKDWLSFDINNTTKYDRTMAAGFTLVGNDSIKHKKESPELEVHQLFRSYRN